LWRAEGAKGAILFLKGGKLGGEPVSQGSFWDSNRNGRHAVGENAPHLFAHPEISTNKKSKGVIVQI